MNSHAVLGVSCDSPRPKPGAGRSSATAPNNSTAASRVLTTNAARCSRCARPTPAVKHRSARAASGCAFNQVRY
ncbi:Uncharacterised protein [Mycobacteroides abscessus subsp. abscessus]|nr:Uncharacterised protein [Mycobacteroides abscessus subsp. abscessus]